MRFKRRAQRTVYANPWIRFEAHDIVHPNGTYGEHGLVVTPPASAIVVYGDGVVYLTRQARFAVDRVVIEVVKGGAEPGETPLQAAQRETREEVGFTAARWDSLGTAFELPSIVALPVSLFLARELCRVPPEPERVETIEAVAMPWSEAVAQAGAGTLEDAITALAILRAAALMSSDSAG